VRELVAYALHQPSLALRLRLGARLKALSAVSLAAFTLPMIPVMFAKPTSAPYKGSNAVGAKGDARDGRRAPCKRTANSTRAWWLRAST